MEPVPTVIIQRQQEASIQRIDGNLIAGVRRCLNAQRGGLFRAALSGDCCNGAPVDALTHGHVNRPKRW